MCFWQHFLHWLTLCFWIELCGSKFINVLLVNLDSIFFRITLFLRFLFHFSICTPSTLQIFMGTSDNFETFYVNNLIFNFSLFPLFFSQETNFPRITWVRFNYNIFWESRFLDNFKNFRHYNIFVRSVGSRGFQIYTPSSIILMSMSSIVNMMICDSIILSFYKTF